MIDFAGRAAAAAAAAAAGEFQRAAAAAAPQQTAHRQVELRAAGCTGSGIATAKYNYKVQVCNTITKCNCVTQLQSEV